MSTRVNRRQILRSATTLAAGSTIVVPYYFTSKRAQEQAKTDRLSIGAVGIGGRGSAILAQAAKLWDVVAVCDVATPAWRAG